MVSAASGITDASFTQLYVRVARFERAWILVDAALLYTTVLLLQMTLLAPQLLTSYNVTRLGALIPAALIITLALQPLGRIVIRGGLVDERTGIARIAPRRLGDIVTGRQFPGASRARTPLAALGWYARRGVTMFYLVVFIGQSAAIVLNHQPVFLIVLPAAIVYLSITRAALFWVLDRRPAVEA